MLCIIREVLSLVIALVRKQPTEEKTGIRFVKGGKKVNNEKFVYQLSIVKKSDDWIILMNTGNYHYEFSLNVVITAKCLDIQYCNYHI